MSDVPATAVTTVILVRHGESVGNVAREAAEAQQAEVIAIEQRDPDVPLSELGTEQARAVGRWLAGNGTHPQAVWASPYVRAVQTCQLALGVAGIDRPIRLDERFRDRELGILDRLTGRGVRARYPDEADRRRYLGKLYYRPPGGESWADVALRLRSVLDEVQREGDGTALVFCHDAIILLIRYVLENLTEAQLYDVAAERELGNGSVTVLERADAASPWRATLFNETAHVAGVTAQAGR